MRKIRSTVTSLAVIGALTLAGCSATGGGDEGEAPEQKLTIGIGEHISGMDPQSIPGGMNNNFHYNAFEGLYTISPNGDVVEALATSHEVDATGTVHTFGIREGVTFHNGDKLTADDIVFSFERALDPEFGAASLSTLKNITEVKKLDDFKVEFTLGTADVNFKNKLLTQSALIVPQDYLTEMGDEGFKKAPVGTGPFKFKELRENESLTLEAFEDFHGDVPTIKTLVFKGVTETATRSALLQTGEVDMIVGVEPTLVKSLEGSGYKVTSSPLGEILMVKFRPDNDALADPRVRQAFNYAVDVDAIIDTIYQGQATALNTTFAASSVESNTKVKPYGYDPEKAKQLLKEAGFDNSVEIAFDAPRGRWLKSEEAGEAIAANLRDVGVNLKLNMGDISLNRTAVIGYTVDPMFLINGQSRTFDPIDSMKNLMTCEGSLSYWCDEELDQLMAAAGQLPVGDRQAAMDAVVKRMYDNPPAIFLWEIHETYAATDKVNWVPTLGSNILFAQYASIK